MPWWQWVLEWVAVPHLESKLSVGGGRSGVSSLGVTDGLLHLSMPSDHTVFPSGLLAAQCGTQSLIETGKSRNLTVHEINSECWKMPCSPVCSGTRQSSQLFHLNRSAKQKKPVSMDRKDCLCSLKWRLYHHHTAPNGCFRNEWDWGLRGAKARKIPSYTHLLSFIYLASIEYFWCTYHPATNKTIFVLKNLQLHWEVRPIKNPSALYFPSLTLINLIYGDPVNSKIHQQTVNVCDISKIEPPVGRWFRW